MAGVNELHELTSRFHDMWLDIDGCSYDRVGGRVRLPIYNTDSRRFLGFLTSKRKVENRFKLAGVLIFNQVRDFAVEDSERIGFYDIDEFLFHESEDRVEIRTGCPIQIRLIVDTVDFSILPPHDRDGG